MNDKDSALLQKAREYVFLLLKFRLRSERELYSRLKRKKFIEPIIKKTISFLKNKGFINDTEFAESWIASRIKKPLGLRRLRQELRLKGIDKEIIEGQIQKIKESYCEEEVVLKIAKEKFSKLTGIEPNKAKRRIFGLLMRRGFSPDIISDAINQPFV